MRKHWITVSSALASIAALAAGTALAQERPRLRPLPRTDRGVKTGPAVGEKIPAFQAVDQEGKVRSFPDLKGPRGLVLMFVRSAEW